MSKITGFFRKKNFSLTALISLTIISFSPAVKAQKLEEVNKDWSVLTTVIDSNKVCFIASLPTLQEGNYKERKDTFILVNLFPERKPEVSFSPGLTLNQEKPVIVTIDDKDHELAKIKENIAWTKTTNGDADLVVAMKKGLTMQVRSNGQNGDYAIDKYSLRGFTASYEKMFELCSGDTLENLSKEPEESKKAESPASKTDKN